MNGEELLPYIATDSGGPQQPVSEHWPVLIFIPTTIELQRFVLGRAFDKLANSYKLVFVVPKVDAEDMRSAIVAHLPHAHIVELDVPTARFKRWSKLFSAACFRYADRSRSFALRASLSFNDINPKLVRNLPKRVVPSVNWVLDKVTDLSFLPDRLRDRLSRANDALRYLALESVASQYLDPGTYQRFVETTLADLQPLDSVVEILRGSRPLFAIIPSSLLDIFCNEVLWACEIEKVPCLVLQSGWDNLSSKGVIHHQPTFLGAWGPQSRRHAAAIQAVPEHLSKSLGAPHYEMLRAVPQDACVQFRRSLGIKADETLLLLGGSFRQFDESETLQRLDEAIDRGQLGNAKILYRPHPWRADRQAEDNFFDLPWRHVVFDPDMESRYLRAKQEPGYLKRSNPMYDMEYLGLLLSSVDAVVSPMSTLLIEAMLLNKPTMAIAFGDGKHAYNPSLTAKMTHFQELADGSSILWCVNSDRFIDQTRLLLNMVGQTDFLAAYRRVLSEIVQTGPGSYADRLAEFCTTTVAPAARLNRDQYQACGGSSGLGRLP